MIIINIDEKGNTILDKTIGGARYVNGRVIHEAPDGGYIVLGDISINEDNDTDLLLMKLRHDTSTSVEQLPESLSLSQNYPNPFNPVTNIAYSVPTRSFVVLRVFDLLGREIAMLANGPRQPGRHTVSFGGSGLSSGIYFYRLHAGSFFETKKMILMR